MIPMLEKPEVVSHKEKLLKDLGRAFVVLSSQIHLFWLFEWVLQEVWFQGRGEAFQRYHKEAQTKLSPQLSLWWLNYSVRYGQASSWNCTKTNQAKRASWFYRSCRHYYALGLRRWFCSSWGGQYDRGPFKVKFRKLKRCRTNLFIIDTLNHVFLWKFFNKLWMYFHWKWCLP